MFNDIEVGVKFVSNIDDLLKKIDKIPEQINTKLKLSIEKDIKAELRKTKIDVRNLEGTVEKINIYKLNAPIKVDSDNVKLVGIKTNVEARNISLSGNNIKFPKFSLGDIIQSMNITNMSSKVEKLNIIGQTKMKDKEQKINSVNKLLINHISKSSITSRDVFLRSRNIKIPQISLSDVIQSMSITNMESKVEKMNITGEIKTKQREREIGNVNKLSINRILNGIKLRDNIVDIVAKNLLVNATNVKFRGVINASGAKVIGDEKIKGIFDDIEKIRKGKVDEEKGEIEPTFRNMMNIYWKGMKEHFLTNIQKGQFRQAYKGMFGAGVKSVSETFISSGKTATKAGVATAMAGETATVGATAGGEAAACGAVAGEAAVGGGAVAGGLGISATGVGVIIGVLMLIVGALVLIAGLIKMSFKNEYSGYMKGMLKLLDVIFNLALKPIADVIGMFLLPVLKLLLPILIKMNKKAGKILGDIKMPENFDDTLDYLYDFIKSKIPEIIGLVAGVIVQIVITLGKIVLGLIIRGIIDIIKTILKLIFVIFIAIPAAIMIVLTTGMIGVFTKINEIIDLMGISLLKIMVEVGKLIVEKTKEFFGDKWASIVSDVIGLIIHAFAGLLQAILSFQYALYSFVEKIPFASDTLKEVFGIDISQLKKNILTDKKYVSGLVDKYDKYADELLNNADKTEENTDKVEENTDKVEENTTSIFKNIDAMNKLKTAFENFKLSPYTTPVSMVSMIPQLSSGGSSSTYNPYENEDFEGYEEGSTWTDVLDPRTTTRVYSDDGTVEIHDTETGTSYGTYDSSDVEEAPGAIIIHDGIITPQGRVVQMQPDDWVFAMKNPANINASAGGEKNINININMTVDSKVSDLKDDIYKLTEEVGRRIKEEMMRNGVNFI